MKIENWFKHDIDSRLVPCMQIFVMKTGASGYGFFWAVIEEMHRSSKPKQSLANIKQIGATLNLLPDAVDGLIDCAVDSGLWQIIDDGIFSFRAEAEQAERDDNRNYISQIRAEAGRIGGKQNQANRSKLKPEEKRLDEKRREEKRNIKEKDLLVEFPVGLQTNECRLAWGRWLEHKRTKNQKYKSTKTQEQALANWKNATPEEFISAVNFSIGNNYSGIFAAPNRNHVQQNKSPAQKTFETASELLKKALHEESILENRQNEKI